MQGTDEDLVARALAGRDPAAFGELVRRHQSRIRSWLRQLTRDAARADDLAQEAFVTAWQKLGTFTGQGRFGSWLMKIAYHEFLQAHRERQRDRRLVEAVAREAGPDEPATDPSGQRDAAADLEKLLAVLSDDERHAMVLCYAHGLSHTEASEVTGMPVGTLKSHIHRAREKVRARFPDGGAPHG